MSNKLWKLNCHVKYRKCTDKWWVHLGQGFTYLYLKIDALFSPCWAKGEPLLLTSILLSYRLWNKKKCLFLTFSWVIIPGIQRRSKIPVLANERPMLWAFSPWRVETPFLEQGIFFHWSYTQFNLYPDQSGCVERWGSQKLTKAKLFTHFI